MSKDSLNVSGCKEGRLHLNTLFVEDKKKFDIKKKVVN